ncbi:MAG: 50S ribosomal protein L25 [Planctomycetota bacterium]|jgi:large subunit ribosomal protein L25
MSETVALKASVRELVGSRNTVRLRGQGKLPAVVYGHKQEPVSISLDAHEFVESLHHGNRIFDVDIDGSKDTLLVKDIQYDYLGKTVIHADLMRVNLSERVKVQVMIDLRGTAVGTHMGGIVEEMMNAIEVECAVQDIPDALPVNIKDLGFNEVLHARQIELPEGFVLVTDPEAVVVTCHETKAAIAEEEVEEVLEEGAEEGAEPEVITEKKEEESSE